MTHSFIQENNIADRYALGKLSAEEESLFEEHLVDCQECLDQLESIAHLRRGIATIAGQEAARRDVEGGAGILEWSARQKPWPRRVLLSAAVVLLGGLPSIIFIIKTGEMRRELGELRSINADLQRQRTATGSAGPGSPNANNPGTTTQATSTAGQAEPNTHAAAAQFPVFALNMTRSSDRESAVVNELSISRAQKGITLLLEFEGDARAVSYTGVMVDEQSRLVWKDENLRPNGNEEIAVKIPRSLLRSGRYQLTLDSCQAQGQCSPVANYSFHLTIAR